MILAYFLKEFSKEMAILVIFKAKNVYFFLDYWKYSERNSNFPKYARVAIYTMWSALVDLFEMENEVTKGNYLQKLPHRAWLVQRA